MVTTFITATAALFMVALYNTYMVVKEIKTNRKK